MILRNELNSIPELKTFKNLPMNFQDHDPKDHGLIWKKTCSFVKIIWFYLVLPNANTKKIKKNNLP